MQYRPRNRGIYGVVSVLEWLAFAVSLVALGISVIAYRSGLPRLKISTEEVTLLGNGAARNVVEVRVDNNGGAAAQLKSVEIRALGTRQVAQPELELGGATFPLTLPARGGSEVWSFSEQSLSQACSAELRDGPHPVRVDVIVGSKRRSRRGRITFPGAHLASESRRGRVKRIYRQWTDGQFYLFPEHRVDGRGVEPGHIEIVYKKPRFGIVRAFTLTLVGIDENGARRRRHDFDQVKVGTTWPWQAEKAVVIPVIDASRTVTGESLYWAPDKRSGSPAHWSMGALLSTDLERYLGERDA